MKRFLSSPRSFYCAMAGSLCLGPHGHAELLLHGPPACLSSHSLARSLRGIPRGSWLLHLAACSAGGSQHLCLPSPLCRYFIPPLLPLFTLTFWRERRPLDLSGSRLFCWIFGHPLASTPWSLSRLGWLGAGVAWFLRPPLILALPSP